ncbi:hypothetical protein MMPV_000286 [Pyropia vietnamensis]
MRIPASSHAGVSTSFCAPPPTTRLRCWLPTVPSAAAAAAATTAAPPPSRRRSSQSLAKAAVLPSRRGARGCFLGAAIVAPPPPPPRVAPPPARCAAGNGGGQPRRASRRGRAADDTVTDGFSDREVAGEARGGDDDVVGAADEGPPLLASEQLIDYSERRAAGLLPPLPVGDTEEFADAWAAAVGPRKYAELKNAYARLGILIHVNFEDFAAPDAAAFARAADSTLSTLAATKARAVYLATGLPAISEASDFAIEPPSLNGRVTKVRQTGYYTRAIDGEADDMIAKVQPISDVNRMTRFRSAVAYYDGEAEIITHGVAAVAIQYASAKNASIAQSTAFDELYRRLMRRFRLELSSFEAAESVRELSRTPRRRYAGAMLLRERILREGKVLSGGILKVSSFLNHQVDAQLAMTCGEELAARMRYTHPTKILTVEATGLIPSLALARALSLPLVFARKSRPMTISESYQASYRSHTKGTTSELIVSTEYLKASDRILIVDDFLAGGSTCEALFKLARMARATVVGVAVLIEKTDDAGRAFLSGYEIPVVSLAKVSINRLEQRVDIADEEPFEDVAVDMDGMDPVSVIDSSVTSAVAVDGYGRQLADDDDDVESVDSGRWTEDDESNH